MFILDTNVLIALQKLNPLVRARYKEANAAGEVIGIPALVRYEARRELVRPLYARRLALLDVLLAPHPTLDLDTQTTDIAAILFENLRAGGNLIEDADLLIAATALHHRAALVTHNVRHFKRIPGLNLTNWQQENPIP